MKVLYVTMSLPNPCETFASSDVRALKEQGCEVAVASLRRKHPRHAKLVRERRLEDIPIEAASLASLQRAFLLTTEAPGRVARLIRLLARVLRGHPTHLVKSLALLPRAIDVADRIRRERPDVVHLFWGHYPALVAGLLLADRDRPVISMFLGAYDLAMQYGLSRHVAPRVDVVWTHAHSNVDEILALGVERKKLVVCHRGIDTRPFTVSPTGRVRNSVAVVGRLIPEKRVADAIRVLARVRKEIPDATLQIAGEGSDRCALEDLTRSLGLENAVRFLGHLSHANVRMLLSETLVELMPSQKLGERLPNAVKEAMAAGCVCVVAQTPGIQELIDHGRTGFIFQDRYVEQSARVIAELLRNDERRAYMATQARAHVVSNFDNCVQMGEYLSVWRELATARSGQRLS